MGSGSGKDNGGLMQAPSIRDGAMLRNTPGPWLREQGAVDRLAEVAKTLGSHQTAELRECVKHLERRGRRHV